MWSALRAIRRLFFQNLVWSFHNTSHEIPQPLVATHTAKLSCYSQYFIFDPTSHLFDSAPEECWIFVVVNIPLNIALKYWNGVTKILNLLIYSNYCILMKRENLQFQVTSSRHHPNIFCPILGCLTELHLINSSKLPYCLSFIIEQHLGTELTQICIWISYFEVIPGFFPCLICNFIHFICYRMLNSPRFTSNYLDMKEKALSFKYHWWSLSKFDRIDFFSQQISQFYLNPLLSITNCFYGWKVFLKIRR